MENNFKQKLGILFIKYKYFFTAFFMSSVITIFFLLNYIIFHNELGNVPYSDIISIIVKEQIPSEYFLMFFFVFTVSFLLFYFSMAALLGNDSRYLSGGILKDEIDKKVIQGKEKGGVKLNKKFNWAIPYKFESSHFFISGSPGSGKTQLILPLMESVRKRGDKCIIYDNKGDFTEKLSTIKNEKFILMAPWDKRGAKWLIGRDLFNNQLIREFANKLIPDAEEIIYSNTARMIVAGCAIYLKEKHKNNWGVTELLEVINSPREELYEILQEYAPEAAELIREPTKLAQNIITNVSAGMAPLVDLANSWKETEESFSLIDLINGGEQFTLVLQGSGIYKNMANGIIRTIIATSAAIIETLPDSFDRRIWFFLDEFPQLGKIEGFTPILEIGRSKGACCVIAVQNFNQLNEIYGEDVSRSIRAMCKTQIYGFTSMGDSAMEISKSFSKTRWEKRRVSLDDKGNPVGYSFFEEEEDTVPVSLISGELGPQKDHINMLLFGYEDYIFKFKLPYTKLKSQRPKNDYKEWAKYED